MPNSPDRFRDVEHLEEVMTTPTPELVAELAQVDGDIIILGVGGKIGPTLARLAKRAAPNKRVVGVARFSEAGLREKLDRARHRMRRRRPARPRAGRRAAETAERHLHGRPQVRRVRPRGPHLGDERACVRRSSRRRSPASRIVAYSTGCVYPYVDVRHGGATEATPMIPPPGAYANSCVAREQMFQYFSRTRGTPGRTIRLNYAIDMRYGVLFDVAAR